MDEPNADIVISLACPISFPIQEYLAIPPRQVAHDLAQDMLEKVLENTVPVAGISAISTSKRVDAPAAANGKSWDRLLLGWVD